MPSNEKKEPEGNLQDKLRSLFGAPDPQTDSYGLTAREREVLQLIAEGRTSKQIAERLHVSVKTVETHRQQLMDKLHIHNIAELAKFAIREGLTSEER
jgi:DNA-binding NarL/FixJ family response regulator